MCDAGRRVRPPRPPEQPIFCPVTTLAHAERVARGRKAVGAAWGFVTRVDGADDVAARQLVGEAGGRARSELRVPAAELAALDDAIVGRIGVVAARRGGTLVPPAQTLRRLDDA